MERVREGHRASFGVLVECYWAPLVTYAVRILGDRDRAQDVVQRTFIQVWQKRSEWVPTGTVNAYLYRITRNLALNAKRDHQKREDRRSAPDLLEIHRRAPRGPDEQVEADSLRTEVEDAIGALSDRRREVFVLSRFHGLTHQEIAETLGTSRQTVANQMSAALRDLRAALSHHMKKR